MTAALPPLSAGTGSFSMSAVCTSANERNICCNSGRFTNLENRAFDRREDPSGDFHVVHDLAEGGGPCVEMADAALFQQRRGEIPLQRVHLDHRIADGRAGCEHEAPAPMPG